MNYEYVWSPSASGFYPLAEKVRLAREGQWPADGVEITTQEYNELFPPPPGQYIDTVGGRPAWVDTPPPTEEQLIAAAEETKSRLRAQAESEIGWRQYAVDEDIATDEEKQALAEWRKYLVMLMRISTADANGIVWPPIPE